MTQTRTQPVDNPEALARTIVLRRLTASARTQGSVGPVVGGQRSPTTSPNRCSTGSPIWGSSTTPTTRPAFADSRRTRSRWSRRASPPNCERGVDRELIDEVLATVGPDDEFASALALGRRKWAQDQCRTIRRRRLVAMLARRGYRHEIVSSVLATLEREDLEAAE